MLIRHALVVALALVALAACTTTEPTATPPPPEPEAVPPDTGDTPPAPERLPPEPAPDPTPEPEPQPEPEAEPDPLYELTEDELRVAFTDGLFGLHRAEVDPAAAQQLDASEVQTWLTDLALVSPRAVEFAHETLGPVLDQAYLVGFVLEDAAVADCASMRDVLFIPIPERFQDAERPFDGYIVQDVCDITDGDLARFCTGGFGTTDDGADCSCVCTTGEAPGLECVACGDE